MSSATNVYVSASANRTSQAADVSCHSLLCFATGNLLSFWDLTVGFPNFFFSFIQFHFKQKDNVGIIATLHGHKTVVNCVKFLQNGFGIVSADQGGALQVRILKGKSVLTLLLVIPWNSP